MEIAVRAEPDLRVVDVQAAEPVEPDDRVELVDDGGDPLGVADVVARGEQVAAVEADPDPLVAVEELDQAGELGEVAAERALGAGGVLEQDRAAARCRRARARSPSRRASSTAPSACP